MGPWERLEGEAEIGIAGLHATLIAEVLDPEGDPIRRYCGSG